MDIKIDSLGAKGDGIAANGMIVPFALPGEEVSLGSQGNISEYIKTSRHRAKPPCIHFYKCGGCYLQHMDDGLYRDFKRGIFEKALNRAGINCDPELLVVGAYKRRRANFKSAPGQLGFYEMNSHNIVDMQECHILEPEVFAVSRALKKCLPGQVKEVLITGSDSGIDILLYSDSELSLESTKGLRDLPGIARICLKTGENITPLIIRRQVTMNFGKAEVELPPEAFLQPTEEGQRLITERVVKALPKQKNVLDIFSGCGTYSFPLAAKAKVHAVEGGEQMVVAIKKAAAKFQAPVTAERRNLNNNPLGVMELNSYDGAVINPPRPGAFNQCKMLSQSAVKKIVMVSCNPDTFSRDAKLLIGGGYKVTSAVAIDQFQWSHHLEIVAVFEK